MDIYKWNWMVLRALDCMNNVEIKIIKIKNNEIIKNKNSCHDLIAKPRIYKHTLLKLQSRMLKLK